MHLSDDCPSRQSMGYQLNYERWKFSWLILGHRLFELVYLNPGSSSVKVQKLLTD